MVVFKVSDTFRKHSSPTSGPRHAMRTGYDEEIDENDETGWRGIIDCRHLHALQVGKQAMSQFGHGKYTVKLHIWPDAGLTGLQQDNSLPTTALLGVKYVMPTKARYAALHHLKTLEKQNAENTQNETNFDGEQHPLLTANVDSDDPMSPGSGTGAILSGNKGGKVIRFGYDPNTFVYAQDSFLSDLDQDGDFNSNNEAKYYNLLGDNDDMFGILPRYEASINPVIDDDGNTVVNYEWDKPLNQYKVFGETVQIQPVSYSLSRSSEIGDDITSAYCLTATFTGIEAMGGLIGVFCPSLLQLGDFTLNNNDFNIYATVTCHSWTPMKR